MNLERDAYRERMLLKGFIFLFTAWYLGAFLWVAFQRGSYPYALSAEEGGLYCAVQRILNSQPLYSEPDLDWVSTNIPPLYPYLSAGISGFLNDNFLALRLVSIFSILALGYIFFRFLIATGVEEAFAFAGFGMLIAGFNALGGYYDLAQITTSGTLLAVLACWISAEGRENHKAVLSGTIIAFAFLTKSEYIFLWLLLLIHWFLTAKKSGLYYIFTSLALILLGLLYFNLIAGEGIKFYLLKLISQPIIDKEKIGEFWKEDLFRPFPLLCLISLIGLYGLLRGVFKKVRKTSDSVMAVLTIGMMGIAFFDSIRVNSTKIDALPMFLAIIALSVWVVQHFHRFEYGLGYLLPVLVKLLVVIQFAILLYYPQALTPTLKDIEAGDRIIATIDRNPGAIYLPNNNYLNAKAGKEIFADWAEIGELKNVSQGIYCQKLWSELDSAFSEGYFQMVILEQPLDIALASRLQNYRLVEKLIKDDKVFWTKAGRKTRPQYVYLRK